MRLDSLLDTTTRQIQLDTLDIVTADTTQIIYQTSNTPVDNLILGMPEGLARILIPVVVTITIFFLGHFISWLKSKFERKKEVNSYKNLISKWIELIGKAIETQIKSCSEFASSLDKSEDMTPLRFSANKLLADKIDSLPLDKLINAFAVNTTGDNDKNYKMTFNLVSQFNFLRHVEQLIEKNYEAYAKFFDELVKSWNIKFIEFDNIISIQSKIIGKNQTHTDYNFHVEVLRIANEWLRDAAKEKNSVRHSENKLILPLIDLTSTELDKSQSDYAFKLSKIVSDLKLEIMQWDSSKGFYSSVFSGTATKIKDAYDKLEEAKLHFESNTKTVSVFRLK